MLMGGHIILCAGSVHLRYGEQCYFGVLGELYIIL